ncbi:MAG: ABC transporter permease [Thermomicrobiales bacterium]
MSQYILRRLAISIPVLLGVTIIAFLLVNLAPGDPVSAMIDPFTRAELGDAWVERRQEQLGLNDPVLVRYGLWLREIVQGNLGYSLINGQPVLDQIMDRVGPTVLLMGAAIVISMLIGIPLGIFSAVRQYSILDYLTTALGFMAVSTPSFFLALGLMYLFAVELRWLPTSGMRTLGKPESIKDLTLHMVMPVTVLALAQLPLFMRYARSAMLEALGADYVVTARAKGLRESLVLMRHAFRNALIPLITITGLTLPELLSGAVITETIFSWPGMGMLAMSAVKGRDYPLILGVILFTATLVLVSNLLSDLFYAVVDPRIRYR